MLDAMNLVWFNGQVVPREQANPSVASYSLHLGIGVFDGIRAFWNTDHYYIHALQEHLTRLRDNAATLEMIVPFSIQRLELAVNDLLKSLPPADYYLRPIVYRTSPTFLISNRKQMPVDIAILAMVAPRGSVKPMRCHISPIERISSKAIPIHAKICGTYVNTYLVRAAAEAASFDEGIMLDRDGKITEAAAANLLFIQGNTVLTPPLTTDIFPGLTRKTIIGIANQSGIQIIERDIYPQEISKFDAVFSSATFSEIKPCITIDDYCYDTPNNPIFKHFLREYQNLMSS